jgi:hypothetical protein
MEKTLKFKMLPCQRDFVSSDAIHTALVGGYGSGKSQAGVLKSIIKKFKYKGINTAYYLPTYGLINDVAIPKFKEYLDSEKFRYFGFSYDINRGDKNITIFHGVKEWGKIILRSMDNPSRIIGYDVGYSLIDEADILPTDKMTDVYSRIIARNRSKLPNGDKNITDVVGTPEGYRWMYNYFVKNTKTGRKLIKARTMDNPFLPESYIETLTETYSEEQLMAYLGGEFVNLTSGTVYYNFDRDGNNSNEVHNDSENLYIGMDFNVGNMSAVTHIIRDTPIAVDEITKAYDTDEMCRLIKERYPGNRIYIYPDASGKNRSTNATTTDIGILENAGFNIRARNRNPIVNDRIKNMNRMFLNGKGDVGYYVNTSKCPDYTEALERMAWDKNGSPDKSNGFDHITDAGGYFIFYEYPLLGKEPINEYYADIEFD